MAFKVVFLRHGISQWNIENRFTGWTDVDLSSDGEEEARSAARMIKESGLGFDICFTSVLKRAIRTLWIVLQELDMCYLPIINSYRLNERHYGALQGLNKLDTLEKYGEEQLMKWRRSYDIQPPALTIDDERYSGNDPRYAGVPKEDIPLTECLKDTLARVMPVWEGEIVPKVKEGKRALVAAHGNSIRAIIKHVDNIADDEIVGLNIPTGIPLVYEFDENMKPIKHYYLADEATVQAAIEKVKNQSKKQ